MTTNETQDRQPDALTRLAQWVTSGTYNDAWMAHAAHLISEARKGMEALRKDRDDWKAVAESVGNAASNALRMVQRQGRVELAQDMLEANVDAPTKMPRWAVDLLRHEIDDEDGGHPA
jgi:hypothetical protein